MTQSNDLPNRMDRAEDNIIDLKLAVSATLQAIDKNSANIAQLIEVSRNGLEMSRSALETGRNALEVSRRSSESIAELGDIIRSNQGAIERMDRLLDYLMRPDQAQEQ
ncbi:MAG: hypothetical protein IGR76_17260 [Synechococcales cyanobacterium T60_A2020_003]|nr:hypothetical protein [Synechococcales cyanobacterium T60_A2020_003]